MDMWSTLISQEIFKSVAGTKTINHKDDVNNVQSKLITEKTAYMMKA